MCDCTMLADNVFSPVTIQEEHLTLVYVDRFGTRRELIADFKMNIKASRAGVYEVKNADGVPQQYIFTIE